LIEKIKCLEDELIESQMQLEKFYGDKFATSSSHVASTSKTIFVKPEIFGTHISCLDKGKNVYCS
jgi:hypothetical protein